MWARFAELLIGCWLAASPFLLPFNGQATGTFEAIAGSAIGIFAVASLWAPLARLHLMNLVVAALLVIPSYAVDHPAPPHVQNRIIVGMILTIFAVIPTGVDERSVPNC